MKLVFQLSSFLIGLIISFSSPSLFASNKKTTKIVLLVPGFFNSFAPEYFSKDIVSSFAEKNLNVFVVNKLNPVGSFEENGERLFQIMSQIESDYNDKVEFSLVGHSAGGLYSLYVANKRKFNIKYILTVSTPLKGIEFVDDWLANSLPFRALTELAQLDSLKQFTPDRVQKFLSEIRISSKTKIISFGGYQNQMGDIFDARSVSLPLRVTGMYINGNSDGIVSYTSALGTGTIKVGNNQLAWQENASSVVLALEHWEQVLDANSFIFLGIRNLNYIRQEQKRFYGLLADRLSR